MVVAREFNCVCRDVDSNCVNLKRVGSQQLGNFLTDFDLNDGWVYLHGRATHYTWVGQGKGSRLDRCTSPTELVDIFI